MKRLKFILAVESYIIRKGLSAVLNTVPGIHVVKETDTVAQLEQLLKNQIPDFILICETLFDKATEIYLKNPTLVDRTVLLHKSAETNKRADIKKSIFLDDSKEQIRMTLENLLTPYFKTSSDPALPDLSEREKTIVKYVAAGMTNKEIADKLFLSAHTVITHRKNIGRKLNIKSASGLTVYAIVSNIISIDEISGLNP